MQGKKTSWRILSALAVAMQTSESDDGTPLSALRIEAALMLLGQRVRRPGASPRTVLNDGEALLRDLEIQTGLLQVDQSTGLSRQTRYVRFRHRTFQEFLVAKQFADSDQSGPPTSTTHAIRVVEDAGLCRRRNSRNSARTRSPRSLSRFGRHPTSRRTARRRRRNWRRGRRVWPRPACAWRSWPPTISISERSIPRARRMP